MATAWADFKVGDKVVQRSCIGRKQESVGCPGVVLTIKNFYPQHALGAFVLSEKGMVEFEEDDPGYEGFTHFTSDFMLVSDRLEEIARDVQVLQSEVDRIRKALE